MDTGTENILKGNWMQARGQVKAWWGELTEDQIDEIDGNRTKLAGTLREQYGWEQAKTESEIDRFMSDLERNPNGSTNRNQSGSQAGSQAGSQHGNPNGNPNGNQHATQQGNSQRNLQGNQQGNSKGNQDRNPQGNREAQRTKGHGEDR